MNSFSSLEPISCMDQKSTNFIRVLNFFGIEMATVEDLEPPSAPDDMKAPRTGCLRVIDLLKIHLNEGEGRKGRKSEKHTNDDAGGRQG